MELGVFPARAVALSSTTNEDFLTASNSERAWMGYLRDSRTSSLSVS